MGVVTLDDLEARRGELHTEIREIDTEFAGQMLPEAAKERWNALNQELEIVEQTIQEVKLRQQTVEAISGQARNVEDEPKFVRGRRVSSHVPDDPTQLEQYRSTATSYDDLLMAYRDGAMKVIERMRPVHPEGVEAAQGNVANMLDSIDLRPGEDGDRSLARRVIATSSKGYEQEFRTYLKTQGRIVGKEMERAASLTNGAGGFAVPVVLDPTVILVSSGVINPVRQLARVERTVGNHLEFVSSTGITAGYAAEGATAADGAPTLVQPTLDIEKAFAFVPMSIEIAEDWGAIQSSMAMMFADAKDTIESTKFLTGLGHASHEPLGLIAPLGATAIVTSGTTATVGAQDLYNMEAGLSPRFLARASFVGARAAFQKIRQLDTAGGANLWVQLQNSNPPTLIGYDSYVWSAYPTSVASGATVLTLGDFNQFLIADRVGMSVEVIPHLFGTAQGNLPTGQRGLYAYWRNSSTVLTPGLQANSAFISLKCL
jgi:HK97 family phage major capsid protein